MDRSSSPLAWRESFLLFHGTFPLLLGPGSNRINWEWMAATFSWYGLFLVLLLRLQWVWWLALGPTQISPGSLFMVVVEPGGLFVFILALLLWFIMVYNIVYKSNLLWLWSVCTALIKCTHHNFDGINS